MTDSFPTPRSFDLVAGTEATDQSRSFISASVNVQYCMKLPVRQRVKPAINELYHRRSLRLNRSIIRLERKRTCRIRTGKYSGRTAGRWIFPLVFLTNAQPVSLLTAFDLVDFVYGYVSLGLDLVVVLFARSE